MASGSASSGLSSYYNAYLTWTSTPDETNNRSLVSFSLYAVHYAIYQTVSASINFNGLSWSGSKYIGTSEGWQHQTLICSGSTYVGHNSDGTLGGISVEGSVSYNLNSSSEGWVGSRTCSTTVTFDTIPRGSSITSVSDVNAGTNPTVTWTSNSSAFRFGIKFVCGNATSTEQSIAASSTLSRSYSGYTIPIGWVEQFTTSKTKTATCYLYTYDSSNTKIGEASKNFTITCVGTPSISSLSSARTDSGGWSSDGIIVQSISSVRITVATTSYMNSAVRTAELFYNNTKVGNSVTVTNNSAVFNISADWYGSRTYTVKITDARTNTAESSISISSWKYSAPALSASYSMNGTTLTVSAECVISNPTNTSSASSATKSNTATISGTATDISVSPAVVYTLNATGGSTITESCTKEFTATGLDITHTYSINLELQDVAGSDYKAVRTMSTGVICMSRLAGGNGVAFFDEATSSDAGRVRINGDLLVSGNLSGGIYWCDADTTFAEITTAYNNGMLPCRIRGVNGVYTCTYVLKQLSSTSAVFCAELTDSNGTSFSSWTRTSAMWFSPSAWETAIDVIDDYVTDESDESVTSGGVTYTWHVRKWYGGKAECWLDYTLSNVTFNESWGAMWESGVYHVFPYPSGLFASTPTFFCTSSLANSGEYGNIMVNGKGSASSTPNLKPIAWNTVTTNVYLSLYAIGDWYNE